MKWSFASVGLIIIGLFGIIIILLFHEITVSNEQDYYTLKEATEAAMIEAVDSAYYRLTGKIKMNEEKFVENFTRRFVETSTFGQGNYYINFYQITEYPAKVSLRIVDSTNSYNIYETFDTSLGNTKIKIVNELSAILDGYEIDETYKIVEAISEGEEYISLGGDESLGGHTVIQPPENSVPPTTLLCPQYETLKQKSELYVVSNLRYDYVNKKCTFIVSINVNFSAGADMSSGGYIEQLDSAIIECPKDYPNLKPTGWCTK